MSKLGEMIRNAGIAEIKRRDKKKLVPEDRRELIAALAEYELNAMTNDLSELFSAEEKKQIDINELQTIVCGAMIKMCEKMVALKKDKEQYKQLSEENAAELTDTVKEVLAGLLGSVDIEDLKSKITDALKKKGKGVPSIPGAPVFGPLDKTTLN